MEGYELIVLETDNDTRLIKEHFDNQGKPARLARGLANCSDSALNRLHCQKKYLFSPEPTGTSEALYDKSIITSMVKNLLGENPKRRLVLYGSGNYHHYTYGLCRLADALSEEYGYIHIDHHSDFKNSASPLDSNVYCGSFVQAILAETNASEALFIGSRETQDFDGSKLPHPSIIERELMGSNGQKLLEQKLRALPRDVYLTIDLDVMHRDEIATSYDRGIMRKKRLMKTLDTIKQSKNIISADALGLVTDIMSFNCTVEKSLKLYEDIADMLMR